MSAMPRVEKRLDLRLVSKDATENRTVSVGELVIAGWTGRDVAKVQEHIEELAHLGVKAPASVPCYYRVSLDLLTTEPVLQMLGADSSGEAEPVLVSLADGLWVGLGSDHTDRLVESYSVNVSKQICQKPIAGTVWPFAEVAPHWDQLILRSHILEGGGWNIYQDGTLAAIRPPQDIMARYEHSQSGLIPEGTVMLCGTLAAKGGIRPSTGWRIELEDPVLKRSISHTYHLVPLKRSEDMRDH
jgi:hypothetical protein